MPLERGGRAFMTRGIKKKSLDSPEEKRTGLATEGGLSKKQNPLKTLY